MKVLVIGDCHISNNQDISRFKVLGKHIAATRPEQIVFIGDFLTLDCLSFWDKDKRKAMEGRRYQAEIDAGNNALDYLVGPMDEMNANRRKNKKKLYEPIMTYLEGNHEDRLNRFLDYDPTFEGVFSIQKDLFLKERGIAWIPYRDYHYINEVGFTHIPFNEVRPITGKFHIHKALDCTVDSVVYGHTHKLESACKHSHGMPYLQQVLNVGCFFEHKDEYVHGRVTHYWVGVVELDMWKPKRFDVTTHSLSKLRRMYQC